MNSSRRKSLIALAALGCSGRLAAESSTRFKIDSAASKVRLLVQVVGIGQVVCEFDAIRGDIDFDPIGLAGLSQVQIDTSSLKMLDYPFTWLAQSREFLDTSKHPRASFASSDLHFEGRSPVAITGDLTIKGVTRKERFAVTKLEQSKPTIAKRAGLKVEAYQQLSRSQFDILGLTGLVRDLVKVELSLSAVPAH